MADLRHSGRQHPIRVFISHSEGDLVFARKLRNLLAHHGTAQVFSTDDLTAGDKWEGKLRNELSAADAVLVLLTPTSVHSSWVLHEIGAAWALEKPIIPVITRRDVLDELPVALARTQVIELGDVENPGNAEEFVRAFENSLAAAHIS